MMKKTSMFAVKNLFSTSNAVETDDLMNTKKALNSLGYYSVPPHRGIDDWTDDATFDGLKRFQRDNGLKVDGLMRPGGPTEAAISRNLVRVSSSGGSNDRILDKKENILYDPYSRKPNHNVGINDWDGVARFVEEGDKIAVGTCGPLRVEAYSGGSVSGDDVHYSLKWYSRDKDGKTIPVYESGESKATPYLPHKIGRGFSASLDYSPPFKAKEGENYTVMVERRRTGSTTFDGGSPALGLFRPSFCRGMK